MEAPQPESPRAGLVPPVHGGLPGSLPACEHVVPDAFGLLRREQEVTLYNALQVILIPLDFHALPGFEWVTTISCGWACSS